ncbi:MAG: ABC transporter permease [candidate division WOR-3 bacterium]|nr:ABC transporter permease [candidate division WOR-3 bacterium]MCX7836526.1 ABC transporter permease [candidate division WOR-3 bacterium]MDW8113764.1 ABC transporter permease [candidate division WOR-3 bacterium]
MRLKAIILNTFIESLRDKILLVLLIVGFILMASSRFIKPLALGEEAKIIKDLSLSTTNFISVLIAILIGGRLIYKEIEKRTIYLVLSKPIKRGEFILGKYFGQMLLLFIVIGILTIAFGIVLLLANIKANYLILLPNLLLLFQLSIITSLAIFFSTFTTPLTASVFTFLLYFIGHLTRDLKALAQISKSVIVKALANFLYYTLPNLSNFDIKGKVVHEIPLFPAHIYLPIIYGVLWTLGLLYFSFLIFERKDF